MNTNGNFELLDAACNRFINIQLECLEKHVNDESTCL
jgi:hypothetical protein